MSTFYDSPYYRYAARQGVPRAQYNLANCYLNGTGVRQNVRMAVKYYHRAARQGMSEAKDVLEYLSDNGL